MQSKKFEQMIKFLSDVTVTVNVLRVGQAISESTSEQERIALAQSLSNMLGTNNQPPIGGYGHGMNNDFGSY